MQKISLICVGKLKEPFYAAAVAEYQKRLTRHCKLEILELPEQRLGDDPSPAEIEQALAREAAVIEEKLPRSATLIAMCIEGKLLSSTELSETITRLGATGSSQLVFLIGGSFGLHPRIKEQAALRLSMSPMTFPHHLARVMLLEQIYRAYQIAGGSKYHK
ncbi:MAG: 23S rRNA (pseudouridine(1915)-N(3))-methyltransferase RlmH [Oscillospiraceae bacterium]|jgi:23S rRNA (pseudouridine1915-N3)-methyltransferase|nr:23S rRNA (pseudouridine(1915)-N(3))-methyltransferase RlmH [Oscillospiraceae bacterium]MBQ1743057.1 23S rRNA (pseudouridine(1915)-N(3))-methyltransferase RlmH [Oscillospiraceae bacterium]MBQ1835150.1 23S rRNA (pseudouridine(1915)-N(3))-methyltransferase RlmH [Oscillospiraceae bacterium]MBQ2177929.1 23S rRNA (pseudouridine(1915)-N(3))-methyltransferase RlmH [Oscillospiraceae bacterium]MBQ5536256.1 23S rRNA (pseudouridine(1915)-N(3))-methyltransferase RlmH [Oscillospiraceae bacterium]